MDICKAIEIFAEAAEESEKKVEDLGEDLSITQPLVEDLLKSMRGARANIDAAIEKVENDKDNEYPQELVEQVRDFTGNLALLCNMILNGKNYSEEEKREAIRDDV